MVRSDGKPYKTAAQKGPRGGKTRREQQIEKMREHRRMLDENNLKEIKPSVKNLRLHRGEENINNFAVYGIFKDCSKWKLTLMSFYRSRGKVASGRGRHTKTEVIDRRLLTKDKPKKGIIIEEFNTKKEAVKETGADSSEKVEKGEYLIRPKHNPSTTGKYLVSDDKYYNFVELPNVFKVRE